MTEENKIKFKNKREKRKFYSGKKEIIEQKHASMLEDMLLKLEELQEKGEDTAELEEKIEKQRTAIEKLKTGDKTGMKIMLKANDYGTLDTMVTHILNTKDSAGTRGISRQPQLRGRQGRRRPAHRERPHRVPRVRSEDIRHGRQQPRRHRADGQAGRH